MPSQIAQLSKSRTQDSILLPGDLPWIIDQTGERARVVNSGFPQGEGKAVAVVRDAFAFAGQLFESRGRNTEGVLRDNAKARHARDFPRASESLEFLTDLGR